MKWNLLLVEDSIQTMIMSGSIVGVQSNGKYKLLCSICSGVERVSSLGGYTYKTYGVCGNNQNLFDGNMIAVASYGAKDCYNCECCRLQASNK